MELQCMNISIEPATIFAGGREVYECRIEVKIWGRDKLTLMEMIPSDDFNSRFDWMVERLVDEVKNHVKPPK